MVTLRINNQEIELDESAQIALNYSIEDIMNPTSYKSDFSKSISIPDTINNRTALGFMGEVVSDNSMFNPTKKQNAELLYNGLSLMSGFVLVGDVVTKDGNKVYNINILGELADLFNKLKNKKLSELVFLVDNPNLSHNITAGMVADSFKRVNTGVHQFVRYIPMLQGIYSDFNNKKILNADDTTTELPFEMDEWQLCEFRSYKQKPAVRIKPLISTITDNFPEYDWQLDPSFFSNDNADYSRTLMTCPSLTVGVSDVNKVKLTSQVNESARTYRQGDAIKFSNVGDNIGLIDSNGFMNLARLVGKDMNISISTTISGKVQTHLPQVNNKIEYFPTTPITFMLRVNLGDGDEYILSCNVSKIVKNTDFTNCQIFFDGQPSFSRSLTKEKELFNAPGPTSTITLDILGTGSCYYNILNSSGGVTNTGNYTFPLEMFTISAGVSATVSTTSEVVTQGAEVNISHFLGNELNCFQFLTDYCKLFNLMFEVDGTTVSIKPRSSFFNSDLIDLTDELDASMEYKLNPTPFTVSRFIYGYQENTENQFFKRYTNKTNLNYGDAVVNTGYNIKQEDLRVLDTLFISPLLVSQNIMKWVSGSTFTNYKVTTAASFDVNGATREFVDSSWQLYYEGAEQLNGTFRVTDDTANMIRDEEFYWNRKTFISLDALPIYTPYIKTSGVITKSLDFGKPTLNFAGIQDSNYSDTATLFHRYHRDYILDRYNLNTKTFTGHFTLRSYLVNRELLKKLIYFNNREWRVSKIIDYNPESNSVQLELINTNI